LRGAAWGLNSLCQARNSSQSANQGERGMSVLISILITFLVVILVLYLVDRLPLDSRMRQIVRIIVIIIGVLALLRYLAVF
jgi:hypothetical protein